MCEGRTGRLRVGQDRHALAPPHQSHLFHRHCNSEQPAGKRERHRRLNWERADSTLAEAHCYYFITYIQELVFKSSTLACPCLDGPELCFVHSSFRARKSLGSVPNTSTKSRILLTQCCLSEELANMIDQATSDILTSPDWGSNISLVDNINSITKPGVWVIPLNTVRSRPTIFSL